MSVKSQELVRQIQQKLQKQLLAVLCRIEKEYPFSSACPQLYQASREFLCRQGKRLRPVLFVVGYQGYSRQPFIPPDIYRAALSIELTHDFFLIHDDIIDNAQLRRGQRSMHLYLEKFYSGRKEKKTIGRNLAIVTGDLLLTLGLETLLCAKAPARHKEKVLSLLTKACTYTCMGEFQDITSGLMDIEKITGRQVLQNYLLKTAYYSVACPLRMGATLARAKEEELKKLESYGLLIGQAFQIQDDILGIFGSSRELGKSPLVDLQESKKTLLILQTWQRTDSKGKRLIKDALEGKKVSYAQLQKIRRLTQETGALKFCQNKILNLRKSAQNILVQINIKESSRSILSYLEQSLLEAIATRNKSHLT